MSSKSCCSFLFDGIYSIFERKLLLKLLLVVFVENAWTFLRNFLTNSKIGIINFTRNSEKEFRFETEFIINVNKGFDTVYFSLNEKYNNSNISLNIKSISYFKCTTSKYPIIKFYICNGNQIESVNSLAENWTRYL